MHRPSPPRPSGDDPRVNFFRPRPGFMRCEVSIIWSTLAAWAMLSFGFPIYLALSPQAPLLDYTIFGMPLHYWFSGQFLTLWFILICCIFNLLIDWLTESYHRHRQEGV
jgi:putative solute:sodium symporter small subunit